MTLQACLFSESSVKEAGLWCELAEGIDPVHWARVCRTLGSQCPEVFNAIVCLLKASLSNDTSNTATTTVSRVGTDSAPASDQPLISLGPSGIGGPYQREYEPCIDFSGLGKV